MWLQFADWFFLVFHTGLVLFNLVGWIWAKSRKWHLISMLCVAFSWLVLGAFYGTGYCICTDLHWRVRSEMGKPIHSSSYLQFLVENVTGRSVPVSVLNPLAAVGFTLLLAVSISLNLRDYRSKRILLRTKEAESLERSARNLRS